MTFPELVENIEHQGRTLVWWSPDQIARGEDVLNDPKKGERAWAVPRQTAQWLHDTISRHRPMTILELGTSIGYSTAWMAHAASAYGGHVHTIEIRNYKYDIAKQNLTDGGLVRFVTMYNAPIIDILNNLELHLSGQKIDLVFMDADRGHYHEYFPLIEPFLSPGALIVADNAISHAARMQPFMNLLDEHGWKRDLIGIDNGIVVAHK